VGDGTDIPVSGVSYESAYGTRFSSEQRVVTAADRIDGLTHRQGGEHRPACDLHAEKVKRPGGRRPTRRDAEHTAILVEPDATVLQRFEVWHECQRHERAGFRMRFNQAA